MKEYQIIKGYYGNQKAKRSGLPYMKHIDEAMKLLDGIGASEETKRAYCLHPIFQDDNSLATNKDFVRLFDPYIIMLVIEYRKTAMSYLSKRKITSLDEITLSPLIEVNHMIWADKTQNLQDFMKFHYGKHERSNELKIYFDNWLARLKQAGIPSFPVIVATTIDFKLNS